MSLVGLRLQLGAIGRRLDPRQLSELPWSVWWDCDASIGAKSFFHTFTTLGIAELPWSVRWDCDARLWSRRSMAVKFLGSALVSTVGLRHGEEVGETELVGERLGIALVSLVGLRLHGLDVTWI